MLTGLKLQVGGRNSATVRLVLKGGRETGLILGDGRLAVRTDRVLAERVGKVAPNAVEPVILSRPLCGCARDRLIIDRVWLRLK